MFTDQTDGRQTRSFGTTGSRQTKDVRARIQQVFIFLFVFILARRDGKERDGRSFVFKKCRIFIIFLTR
jgi:hypothetical protein